MLVVAYDIADDQRRVRDLKRRVRYLIRPADKVRYYPLCAACAGRIEDGDGSIRPAVIVFTASRLTPHPSPPKSRDIL